MILYALFVSLHSYSDLSTSRDVEIASLSTVHYVRFSLNIKQSDCCCVRHWIWLVGSFYGVCFVYTAAGATDSLRCTRMFLHHFFEISYPKMLHRTYMRTKFFY